MSQVAVVVKLKVLEGQRDAMTEAANTRMSSEAFKSWSKTLAPFAASAPEISFLIPMGGKGL
jgi:quinol monooxygenase YgiN